MAKIVLIFMIILLVVNTGTQVPCMLRKYCSDSCQCQNFTSFKNLSFEPCIEDQTFLERINKNCTIGFEFLSIKNSLVLDRDFDWSGIMNLNKVVEKKYDGKKLSLSFYNLVGIDLNSRYEADQDNTLASLEIRHSTLNIFLDNQEVVECDHLQPNQSLANLINLIDPLTRTLRLAFIKVPKEVCPEVFSNVNLKTMIVYKTSMWKIKPKTSRLDINCTISSLIIDNLDTVKSKMGPDFLNYDLFSNTASLVFVFTSINTIYPVDLFKSFNKLKSITFQLYNTKGFLHMGINWMQYINYNISAPRLSLNKTNYLTKEECDYIQKENAMVKMMSISNSDEFYTQYFDTYWPYYFYNYPDEDFCLFVDFPHAQLLIIGCSNTQNGNECIELSCTLISILQYVFYYYHPNNILTEWYPIFNIDDKFNNCRIAERTRLCNITPFVLSDHDPFFDPYDLKVGLDQAKTVLLTYFGPVISLLGAVSNALIIGVIIHNKVKYKNKQKITIKNKSRTTQLLFLLDEPLYKYMLINSVLNELYCLLFLVDLSVECVPTIYYDYDISNFKLFTLKNCLNKDIVVYYLAGVLKLTSNVMILEISINRFILLGKDHAEFMLKLAGLNIKKVFIVSLLSASILSVIIVFQQLNFEGQNTVRPDLLMNENYINQILTNMIYIQYGSKPYQQLYMDSVSLIMYISIIYYFFAYFLFCIVCLVMDILTVKRLRQVLLNHTVIAKSDEEAKKMRSAEMRSFYMIISFNLVNFLLRLPDMFSSLYVLISFKTPYNIGQLCLVFSRCLYFEQLSNISYISSLAINLILYCFFYSTFNDCFVDFVETIQSYLKKKDNQQESAQK